MYLFAKPNLNNKEIFITEEQSRYINEMIAYHGSKADFDRFSLAYIGTGVGAQEFGYGIYLTLDREAAEHYGGMCYTVEIPDPNQALYLYYNDPIPEDVYNQIVNSIVDWNVSVYPDEYDEKSKLELAKEIREVMPPTEGRYLMYNLHRFIDEKTYAAQMLKNCGITGYFYNNGKIDNVIIFDTKAINIINKSIVENQNPDAKEYPSITTLGDGVYQGIMSGHVLDYNGSQYYCTIGVRGRNVPIKVKVKGNDVRLV